MPLPDNSAATIQDDSRQIFSDFDAEIQSVVRFLIQSTKVLKRIPRLPRVYVTTAKKLAAVVEQIVSCNDIPPG